MCIDQTFDRRTHGQDGQQDEEGREQQRYPPEVACLIADEGDIKQRIAVVICKKALAQEIIDRVLHRRVGALDLQQIAVDRDPEFGAQILAHKTVAVLLVLGDVVVGRSDVMRMLGGHNDTGHLRMGRVTVEGDLDGLPDSDPVFLSVVRVDPDASGPCAVIAVSVDQLHRVSALALRQVETEVGLPSLCIQRGNIDAQALRY